jgi:hypothetical protein
MACFESQHSRVSDSKDHFETAASSFEDGCHLLDCFIEVSGSVSFEDGCHLLDCFVEVSGPVFACSALVEN